ncbi:nuclear transport factor 2 family protein [Mucilaginibacter sp. Bleaf8]|uniref:nuclear transport factor 2 family protein n=1 Tax=Mucilaginibacter sp. Bleaf8 TaxID=2834430 RepID=UPI001BD14E09|nr:nuclear transport factor 2 family protein [Mucilaginibacter sp. Bleaf8]MBS7564190.1 nuclear transport factor 2 family protein [Mucilaginibacter sp. Bleaf8]
MKTLKSLLFAALLMVSTLVVKADEPNAVKLTKTYAINTYISAVSQGKMQGLNDIVDANAKFSMLRGKQLLTFDKADVLNFMVKNANVKQECTTTASVVESNTDITVVKVDMQYNNFVRSNYVTLANTGNGWKITNVYSVFK